jgi:exodeoxyribonuclease VII large subunit
MSSTDLPNLAAVITVSELNAAARALVEQGLPLAWVAGEVSNFTRAASGHWYFSLKDERAQVRCVMFRHRAQLLDWLPTNGAHVELRATATLYEPRGDFQLNVEFMRRAGLGALFEAFERLKRKLEAEGLFAAERKRPVPPFVRSVGIVTSLQAAALRDVLTTLRRRMPSIRVIVYPTQVQGEGADRQIVRALEAAGRRNEVDVVLLCRGGGSIEDLWSFNEENVARAIAASPIPVVTGVGHETDFTIADFVSDVRAPTPTAAAELVSPDRDALLRRLEGLAMALRRNWQRGMERRMQQTDYLGRRLKHPGERLVHQRAVLLHLYRRLGAAWAHQHERRRMRVGAAAAAVVRGRPDLAGGRAWLERAAGRLLAAGRRSVDAGAQRLEVLRAHLAHLSPEAVLERGYSIARTASGEVVRDSRSLQPGDRLDVTFARGRAETTVLGTSGDC